MTRAKEPERIVATLPIEGLPEGDICPPLEPDHPTWELVAPWDDPLASRGGYRVGAGKSRETVGGQPAIAWRTPATGLGRQDARMFVVGESTWREYSLRCRVQPEAQGWVAPTMDEPFNARARAGLVFRMETLRRHYLFAVEDRRRLVLYRRDDDEWIELAGRDIGAVGGMLTLRVDLDGDGIRAECPECDAVLQVTDAHFHAGLAGFRSLGECRLFALDVAMTPGQEAVNNRRAAAREARIRRLSRDLPDEVEVGQIDLADGRRIVDCTDFHTPGRNDLLLATRDGMTAETLDGKHLWTLPEKLGEVVFSADAVDGRRLLFALAGKRAEGKGHGRTTTGKPNPRVVQDQLLAVDGASGAVLKRTRLPVSPREDLLRHYDLGYETGCLSGGPATDLVVREWRSDWGGGGEMIWAFDAALNLLWERKVHPGYGHHNAVHLFDVDGDGRDEVLAGGNLLSSAGEPIWRHDLAPAFYQTPGGGHYDAVLVGRFSGDDEIDPVAFLIGGSAGTYVVDALTGRTRALHRVGHAQWGLPCTVRADLPGQQIMVGTRWGNFGILTLFSGRGDRLWSIQPDYVLQGAVPVQWAPGGPQHIWCNQSCVAMGLYDGFGRMVKPLDTIRREYKSGTKAPTRTLRRTPDGCDLLGVQFGDTLRLYGAEA